MEEDEEGSQYCSLVEKLRNDRENAARARSEKEKIRKLEAQLRRKECYALKRQSQQSPQTSVTMGKADVASRTVPRKNGRAEQSQDQVGNKKINEHVCVNMNATEWKM